MAASRVSIHFILSRLEHLLSTERYLRIDELRHPQDRPHDIQYGVSLINLDHYTLVQSAQMSTLPLFQYRNGGLRLFIGQPSEKDFVYPISNLATPPLRTHRKATGT